jgi:hypothetical protein
MNAILSMVKSATATDCMDVRAVAFIEAIRTGRWQEPVEAIRAEFARAIGDGRDPKGAVSDMKKRLPAVLPSGRFEHRCNDSLTAHSGLLCADLDNLGVRSPELRQQLINDANVYGLFASPTNTGLKVWFRVPSKASQHAGSFAAVQARCRNLYGVEVDKACKDVAHLCFVSRDPNAYLNRDAAELAPLAQTSKPVQTPTPGLHCSNGNGTLPPSVDRLLTTGAESGERNAKAFALACQLRDAGLPELIAQLRVLDFAANCTPPLAAQEALASLRSAYSKPARDPAWKASPVLTIYAPPSPEDEGVYTRLAGLLPADYDRVRKDEADKLNIRVSTLDTEVFERRTSTGGALQGGTVDFPAAAPWPQPVIGAEVLDAVTATYARYVSLPAHAADTLALWTAHTHGYGAFNHSPRLNLCSPEKQCGKTLVLDVADSLVARPLRTESITPAVLFRVVELHKPTLLLDEVDTYLSDNDELRGLLNGGHKRGAKVYRCEGDKHEVRGFDAYAPAVLAGIGALPGTLHDRSIVIRLVRAKPGEITARFDSRRTSAESEISRKLARWTKDNFARLEASDPTMPEMASNRVADNWRPLFAVAEVAGGDWPARAAAAFAASMVGDDLDAHGIGTTLLADIRTIFAVAGSDRMPSACIAEGLAGLEGKPWPEFGKAGKPISSNQIARLLARFNIRSRTIRIGNSTPKGYYLADFQDTFARYLPATPHSNRNTATTVENTGDIPLSETPQPEGPLRIENAVSINDDAGCGGVAVQKRVSPESTEVLL